MTTYQAENNEHRLMIIIGLGQKYFLVFCKGQFLVHFLLVFPWQIFFVVKYIDMASYTDDSTLFIVKNNIGNVIKSLEQVSNALFNWFKNNRLEAIFISVLY